MKTAEAIARVQEEMALTEGLERSQRELSRALRSKMVSFEMNYVRVLNLDLRLMEIVEEHAFSNPSTETEEKEGGQVEASIYAPRMFASKPFGFAQESAYKHMLTLMRTHPTVCVWMIVVGQVQGLFDLSSSSGRSSLNTESMGKAALESLARSLVYDLYLLPTQGARAGTRGGGVKRARLEAAWLLTVRDSLMMLATRMPDLYLLDTHCFTTRLLTTYLTATGTDYLRAVLGETLSKVILDEQGVEFTIDLLGTPTKTNEGGPENDHGTERLIAVCEGLLQRILGSVNLLPYGIRYVGRLVAKACTKPNCELKVRAASDLVFLHWLVNAIMHPHSFGLCEGTPIISGARRNLQVVATVLIKLMSCSRFTAYAPSAGKTVAPQYNLNDLLEKYEPKMKTFLDEMVDVCELEEYFPMHRQAEVEHDRYDEVVPLCLRPNDVFALHRLLLHAHQSAPEAPRPEDLPEAMLNDAITSLGPLSQPVAPSDNEYIMFDSGMPSLTMPLEGAERADRDSTPWPDSEGTPVKLAFDFMASLTRLLPSSSVRSSRGSLKDIVIAEAEREELQGNTTKGVMLRETLALLQSLTPQPYQANDFRLLLDKYLQHAFLRKKIVLDDPLPRLLVHLQGIMGEETDALRRREQYLVSRYREIQLRRLLYNTRAKIRALRRYLNKREKQLEVEGELVGCGGICPEAPDKDRFSCARCGQKMDYVKGNLRAFINKYATELGPPIEAGLAPPLDLKDPPTAVALTDYVVISAFSEMFVKCQRADDLWKAQTQALRKEFPSLHSFYIYMASSSPSVAPLSSSLSSASVSSSSSSSLSLSPTSSLKIPHITEITLNAAVRELEKMEELSSVRAKLNCFVKIQTMLTAVLQSTSSVATTADADLGVILPISEQDDQQEQNILEEQLKMENNDQTDQSEQKKDADAALSELEQGQLHKALSDHHSPTHSPHHTPEPSPKHRNTICKPEDSSADKTIKEPSREMAQPKSAGLELRNTTSHVKGSGVASAEDYMSLLCFVLVRATTSNFISNIQMVRMLLANSLSIKGFVDVCVALKVLTQITQSLFPHIHLPPSSTVPTNMESSSEKRIGNLLLSMGFSGPDIDLAISTLSLEQLETADGLQMVVDFVTDLNKLTDMGYPRSVAIDALKECGHNISASVQYIQSATKANPKSPREKKKGSRKKGSKKKDSSPPVVHNDHFEAPGPSDSVPSTPPSNAAPASRLTSLSKLITRAFSQPRETI